MKTILRAHITPVIMAKRKKNNWQFMLMRTQGKGNSDILVVEVQTGTVTVEISLAIPEETGNKSASRISYIHHAHIFKGLYILLQRLFSYMVIIALVITASS